MCQVMQRNKPNFLSKCPVFLQICSHLLQNLQHYCKNDFLFIKQKSARNLVNTECKSHMFWLQCLINLSTSGNILGKLLQQTFSLHSFFLSITGVLQCIYQCGSLSLYEQSEYGASVNKLSIRSTINSDNGMWA